MKGSKFSYLVEQVIPMISAASITLLLLAIGLDSDKLFLVAVAGLATAFLSTMVYLCAMATVYLLAIVIRGGKRKSLKPTNLKWRSVRQMAERGDATAMNQEGIRNA